MIVRRSVHETIRTARPVLQCVGRALLRALEERGGDKSDIVVRKLRVSRDIIDEVADVLSVELHRARKNSFAMSVQVFEQPTAVAYSLWSYARCPWVPASPFATFCLEANEPLALFAARAAQTASEWAEGRLSGEACRLLCLSTAWRVFRDGSLVWEAEIRPGFGWLRTRTVRFS